MVFGIYGIIYNFIFPGLQYRRDVFDCIEDQQGVLPALRQELYIINAVEHFGAALLYRLFASDLFGLSFFQQNQGEACFHKR